MEVMEEEEEGEEEQEVERPTASTTKAHVDDESDFLCRAPTLSSIGSHKSVCFLCAVPRR